MTKRDTTPVERLREIAQLRGADPDAWPETTRAEAEGLLDTILTEVRDAPPPAPDEALTHRILGDAAEVSAGFSTPLSAPLSAATARGRAGSARRSRRAPDPFGWLRPAFACAASAALGLWLGYAAPADIASAADEMIAGAGATVEVGGGEEFEIAWLDSDVWEDE